MSTLTTWLWQGIALALSTALALQCLPRLNAATRHAIWWLALAAVILLPIVQIAANQPVTSSPHAAAPAESALLVVPAISGPIIFCLLMIWSALTILSGIRIASGLRLIARLKRESKPFDADLEKRLTMWMSARHTGRRPELRVGHDACGACALGLGRPVILVSQRLLTTLDEEGLDQIVMHEHAHLARFDDWLRLAQAIVASIAGLHPAVWFIGRQIDLDREAACDDRVVLQTGASSRYAACLADAAALAGGSFAGAVIPGAIASRPMLRARVARLLEPRRRRAPGLAPAVCVAAALLFAAMLTVSVDVRPLVAFLESPRATPPGAQTALAQTLPQTNSAARALDSRRDNGNPMTMRSPQATTPASRGSARQSARVAPAATSQDPPARAVERVAASAPLEGSRLEHAYDASSAPHVTRPARAPAASATSTRDAPWNRAADAGSAIGAGARRSGVTIGGYFSRAGKAIARSF